MKVLITGANGYLGSTLVKEFLNNKEIDCLVGVDSFGVNSYEGISKYVFLKMNIEELIHESKLFDTVTHIYHFGQSGFPGNKIESYFNDSVESLIPTLKLIDVIKKMNRVLNFVFPSSAGGVYKISKTSIFSEDDHLWGYSTYGLTKIAIENYLYLLQQENKNIRILNLRITNPYGTLLTKNRKQGLISTIFNCLINDDEMNMYSDDNIVRDYLHEDDFAKAATKALNVNQDYITVNIGSGIGYSIKQIIFEVESFFDKKLKINYVDSEMKNRIVPCNVVDITNAKDLLNWSPEINLKSGLLKMYNQYIRGTV